MGRHRRAVAQDQGSRARHAVDMENCPQCYPHGYAVQNAKHRAQVAS